MNNLCMIARKRKPAYMLRDIKARGSSKPYNGELQARKGPYKAGYLTYVFLPRSAKEKSQVRVSHLNITPEHMRKGIAAKMLTTLEGKADKVVVLEIKGPMIEILKKRGYTVKRDPEEGFWAEKER